TPEVNVELVGVPVPELNSQLTLQFGAGTPPDVAVVFPGLIRIFSGQGFLLPIDDLWDQWIADGWYTQPLRTIASDAGGTAYAAPFKFNVNALMWYSPPQFDELGLQVPTTWDEFVAVLDAIKAAGEEPIAVGGVDRWPLTQWVDSILARVAGQDVFNGLVNRTVAWDDPAVVESLQVFGEIIANYFPADALDRGFIEALCARAEGRAVLQNQGAFVNLITTGECDPDLVPGEDYTFFLMPKFREADPVVQFISGDLFAIARDSDNIPAAQALLNYLASAQAQEIWAARGGFVAPNALADPGVYPDANDVAAAELFPTDPTVGAVYDLDDFIGGETQETWRDLLQELVRSPGDAERIAAEMEAADLEIRGPVGGGG
ncbi:MAG: extracellular solute-binding protein, partial [Dehalococcoidia bacterium]